MARSLATATGRPLRVGGARRAARPIGGRRSRLLPARLRRCAGFAGRHRRALLALILCAAVLAGGWLWLRHSPLVSVQNVQISGVHGPEARAIEGALAAAARQMSTLDVRPAPLRAAVARFHLVRELSASPSFPHGLRIRVIEQLPVAAAMVGGTRTAVAADGAVLGPALLSGALPSIGAGSEPAGAARLANPGLLAAATVLGAAPGPFSRVVSRVFYGPKGLTLTMRNGLVAYFGDATLPHAKWLALVRVLGDPSAAGASYVDVRVPERPAAGFAAGTGPSGPAAGSTGEQGGSSEAAAAALSASLAAVVAGGSSSGREAAPGAPPSGSQASTPASSGPSNTISATPPEAAASTPPAGG